MTMDWLVNKGEVYHRSCSGWSASVASGCCEHCSTPIPEATLRLAKDETDERARLDRVRDVQTSLKAITQRSAETGARADASLARGSSPKRQ